MLGCACGEERRGGAHPGGDSKKRSLRETVFALRANQASAFALQESLSVSGLAGFQWTGTPMFRFTCFVTGRAIPRNPPGVRWKVTPVDVTLAAERPWGGLPAMGRGRKEATGHWVLLKQNR
ncbi:hypothetical protein MPNT_680003 [Candidatus Methylacidithermus pantelleriae]|uniref:Uncharacterized protein n=1 Tax=Candidatus Methylacidithermus pantelleriae TaxID=2744239 RepID=A0A8J2BPF7_9BACT|nr:hypothetical protein MPNT_680003 [Candidatus Methylacidithermus pantelleriae]